MELAEDLLSLTARRHGREVTVVVRGELDLSTAPLVESTLTKLVGDQGCRSLVVDLHDLTFMGSTGLCLLLNARRHVQSTGGEIVLARPSSAVMRILELADLTSMFTIHGDAASERAPSPLST